MVAIIAGGGNNKLASDTEVLWIDATTKITPTFTATLTEHPIDTGASISDHVYMRNTKIEISGVIAGSNNFYEYEDNVVDNVFAAPTSLTQNVIQKPADPRVQSAYDYLTRMFNNRTSFTLISRLQRFDDCVMTSLIIDITPETSEVLSVNITIEQGRIVTSDEITLFQVNPTRRDNAASNTQFGNGSKTRPQFRISEFLEELGATDTAAWVDDALGTIDNAIDLGGG